MVVYSVRLLCVLVATSNFCLGFAGRLAAVSVLMYGLYSLNRRNLARLPLKWSMMRSSMWYGKTV